MFHGPHAAVPSLPYNRLLVGSVPVEQALDRELEPQNVAHGWSRMILPPLKRRGHVIMDVCTPGTQQPYQQHQAVASRQRVHCRFDLFATSRCYLT